MNRRHALAALLATLAMTRDGRITDVKTVVGLGWAELGLR